MRSWRRVVPVLLAVAAVLPGLGLLPGADRMVPPAAAEAIDMAGVRLNVVERRLDNGLTLVMVENHESPTVGLNIQFAVGSVDEYDGISGSAHILEHLLFKGTDELGTTDWVKEKVLLDQIEVAAQDLRRERGRESRADAGRLKALEARVDSLQELARGYVQPNPYDRVYTEEGGQGFNAGTSWDATGYQVALPSNRLELWMKIERDRLKAPVLREFYTELDNIMEEMRLRIEDEPTGPLGKLSVALYATAFMAHRYGVPIGGWPSDIQRVTRTEVEAFFKKYYAPNRMTVAIVGDIDPQKTFEMAQAYFGDIPRQVDPFPPRTVEPPQKGERRVTVEYEAEPRVMAAWHVMSGHDPDYAAYLVMDEILAGGRSSRLHREVVEKQKLAASIGSYTGIPGERYPSLWILEAAPLAPHTTAEVEAAAYAVIDGLKKEPPTDDELAGARLRMRKTFVEGLVDNLGLAEVLGFNSAALGDWRAGFQRAAAIQKVTAADVQRVASTYLTGANRSVATLVKPVAEAVYVEPAAAGEAVEFLRKAQVALGGPAALGALKDTRTEATLTFFSPQGEISAPAKSLLAYDGRSWSEITIMGMTQAQGFDGQSAWVSSPQGTMDAPPDAVAEARDDVNREIFLARFDPGNPGAAVRRLPDGDFQGAPAVILEITPASGKPFNIYLDPKSFLPMGRSYDSQNPLTGAPGRAEEVYSDYRVTGGVQFPGRETIYMGGQKIIDKVTTTRTANTGATAADFKKPS